MSETGPIMPRKSYKHSGSYRILGTRLAAALGVHCHLQREVPQQEAGILGAFVQAQMRPQDGVWSIHGGDL